MDGTWSIYIHFISHDENVSPNMCHNQQLEWKTYVRKTIVTKIKDFS